MATTIRRAYKYRLYPTKDQATQMDSIIETCRHIYNDALTQRRWYYQESKKSIGWMAQSKEICAYRREGDDEYLKAVPAHVCLEVVIRLDKAYQNFFRRVKLGGKPGFPRYKAKARYDSFTYPDPDQQGYGLQLNEDKPKRSRIRLQGVGSVKIRYHHPIPDEARIKTCTIRKAAGRWFACLSFELAVEEREHPNPTAQVGIDAGISALVATSDGELFENPKHVRTAGRKLAIEHRRLSKKKRGSANRNKQKARLAEAYRKVSARRTDNLHKVTRDLVNRYAVIVLEDLQIPNMVKNRRLARSIHDASWGYLTHVLTYKAEEAGGRVIKVDPRGTSQMCSACGEVVKKSLSVRVHNCPHCGLVLDRDINAARNILQAGVACTACGEDTASAPSMKQELIRTGGCDDEAT